jgi:uncharacterized protein (TIGR00255 family)
MTGFARVRKAVPAGEIALSIKSVNHRGLDLHFHLPSELDGCEAALRAAIKQGVARGHLQIQVFYARTAPAAAGALNRPLFEAWLAAFHQAAAACGIEGQPDLNAALRIPGMLAAEGGLEPESGLEAALVEAAREAVTALNAFRAREGEAFARDIGERCASILELAQRMAAIRETAVPAFQKRLRDRLAELLNGAGLEPQRLAQEAAVLAERSDIAEELVRLKTHAGQLRQVLAGGGEVGKRMDFLLQEMNREANTVLSKTGGVGELGLTITELALAAKAEIDKIREQSLNLE